MGRSLQRSRGFQKSLADSYFLAYWQVRLGTLAMFARLQPRVHPSNFHMASHTLSCSVACFLQEFLESMPLVRFKARQSLSSGLVLLFCPLVLSSLAFQLHEKCD